MIAFQTAAKATRDALFLSSFDVAALPRMVIASALASVVFAFLASRWMTVFGPARLVPAAFAASAALLLVEWALVARLRGPIAIVLYLHYGALGATLISGFWSIVNERFDPRTAKRFVGRIAAGATAGSLLGGLLAERVAALSTIALMFPLLAGIHLLCAWLATGIGRDTRSTVPPPTDRSAGRAGEPPARSGLKIIAETPYLRGLVALVLLATVSEGLIDYVFKAQATATYGGGEQLLRLFALFYTGVALLTAFIQTAGSRFTLQHLGLAKTVALLPTGAAAGSAVALAVPGLATAAIARGAEAVLRNGLYRAGYELLFTPVARQRKRATKTLVDVGAVRLGDVAGAGIIQVALLVAAATVNPILLGLAILLSASAFVVSLRLHRGYVLTLEKSLLSRAVQLDLDEVEDVTTRTAVLHTAATLGLTLVAERLAEEDAASEGTAARVAEPPPTRPVPPLDPDIARIVELRSRDPDRIRTALKAGPLALTQVPHVIPLLAWDQVVREAIVALRGIAPRTTGQLVDRLLDRDEEFSIRRRIPLVLAACPSGRAVDGLFRALEDPRFEVRYRCGRVLNRLLDLNAELEVDRERTLEAVLREVAVDRGVWQSHRLLDRMEDDAWSPVLDEVLRERANRSLEHVFTLLALVLPRQPLRIAFRGLHTDDSVLRGTALEYLESALPEDVRKPLWPFLEDRRPRKGEPRPTKEVLEDLLRSNVSIVHNLEELRKRS
jgi:HEAT repeat protein/MFS family permease